MEPYEISESYQYIQVLVIFFDDSEQSFSARMISVKEIDKIKSDILNCFVNNKAYIIGNTIINLRKVKLISFNDSENDEPKQKEYSIKEIFNVISKILSFILLCMFFVYVAVHFCLLFKK